MSIVNAAREMRTVSPRMRMAARLYATGTARTKKEAAQLAQLDPAWFGAATLHNDGVKKLVNDVDEQIMDQSVDVSVVLRTVGREAIKRIRGLMDAENAHVALKAAQDLADRNPETSRVQRHQIQPPPMDQEAARILASVIVEAANVKRKFITQAQSDYIGVAMGDEYAAEIPALPSASAEAASQSRTTTREGEAEVADPAPERA